MKNKLYLQALLMLAAVASQAQSVVLEFNAHHSCAQVNLDSIWIQNLTQGGKMVLYYPNNIAVFVVTDIGDIDPQHNHLYVSQNYPNPFSALTYIDVYLATPDVVSLNVYDLTGRTVARHEDKLEEGMHRFSFSAGVEKTYILTVASNEQVEKRIMLQMGVAGSAVSEISYLGATSENEPKTAPKSSDFNFNPGDNLRFTGFVTDVVGNMGYGVINDSPEESSEYLFDIANTPPDKPSEISGEDYVPENTTGLVYEVHEQEGLTYIWSVPDGWEITHGQVSHAITVNAGDEGGIISVKAENSCGISEASVLAVEVYAPLFELTLEADPTHGGNVSGQGSYPEGEELSITATAYEGWEFISWTGDAQFLDNPNSANTTVTMPANNVTLVANFQEEDEPEPGTVTDIDNNVYQTVIMGNQEWMAENLRVTRYNNEDDIPTGLSNTEWSNTTSGAYAIYDHNASDTDEINSPEEMVAAYGKLYSWYAVDDDRGLCPEGWSVPSHDDWTQLEQYICNALGNSDCETHFPYDNTTEGWRGTNEGNALKSCRQVGSPLEGCNTSEHPRWNSHIDHYGFDEFGFSALPGGYRGSNGNYVNIGDGGYWWASSEDSSTSSWRRGMGRINGNVNRRSNLKRLGFSVRCVRNIE